MAHEVEGSKTDASLSPGSERTSCLALCQIHEAHVLVENQSEQGKDLNWNGRVLERAENNKKTGSLFTCRTLWDQTDTGNGSSKYLPFHEISLDDQMVNKYGSQELGDGEWSLCYEGLSSIPSFLENAQLVPTNRAVDLGISQGFQNIANRQLENPTDESNHRIGTKSLLVVRVNTLSGQEPSATKGVLRRAVFGPFQNRNNNNGELVSAAEQYDLMSHGRLKFFPATFPEQNIATGVMDVFFGGFNGKGIQFLIKDLVEAVEKELNLGESERLGTLVHHTIFCLPDEINAPLHGNHDWTAFTYRGEGYSFYKKNRCSKLSIVAHEIGHATLGFRHSGAYVKKTQQQSPMFDEYADETGYMGYSYNSVGLPRKAFNAHKHWISQWYNEHAMLTIDPLALSGPKQIELVGYTQYSEMNWSSKVSARKNKAVLARLGNLYLQYNYVSDDARANWNIHTAYPDKVTIVTANKANSFSNLIAVLSLGSSYKESDYMGSGKAVEIQVCPPEDESTKMPSVQLLIFVPKNGIDAPKCRTRAFSPAPVARWSPAPTRSPVAIVEPYYIESTLIPTTEQIVIETEKPPQTGSVVAAGSSEPSNSLLPPKMLIPVAATVTGVSILLFAFVIYILRKKSLNKGQPKRPKIISKRTSLESADSDTQEEE